MSGIERVASELGEENGKKSATSEPIPIYAGAEKDGVRKGVKKPRGSKALPQDNLQFTRSSPGSISIPAAPRKARGRDEATMEGF